MNSSVRTIGKQLTWSGCEGRRVRVVAYRFERVRVYNAGSERAAEGPVFVEHAVVLNVAGQPGVWLRLEDVRDVVVLLERMSRDNGEVCDDDCHGPPRQDAVPASTAPSIGAVVGAAVCVERVRSITQQHDRECLARNLDVLAAAARLAETDAEREAGTVPDTDGDCEEEREERQRFIHVALWKGFESLRCLPDERKLPDVIKAEHPVSALGLTQWSNCGDFGEAA